MESVRAKPFKLTVGSGQGSAWAFRKTIQNFPNDSLNGSLQILYTAALEIVSHYDAGLLIYFFFSFCQKKKKRSKLSISLMGLFLLVWDTFDRRRDRPLTGLWYERVAYGNPPYSGSEKLVSPN